MNTSHTKLITDRGLSDARRVSIPGHSGVTGMRVDHMKFKRQTKLLTVSRPYAKSPLTRPEIPNFYLFLWL